MDGVLIERRAMADAVEWATAWCDELAREERPLEGGWPGTLSEARRRVLAVMRGAPGPRLDAQATEQLVRRTYQVARRTWRARCDDEVMTQP